MKKLIILLILATTLYPSGLDNLEFGGYLENKTSLMLSKDELFSDIASLRLEGAWNFGERGGIETHLLLSSAYQPLDPSVTFKEGSAMERVVIELMEGHMMAIDSMGLLDTSLFDPALFEELEPYFTYLPYSSFYPKDKFTMDRALLKLYFKPFDLFIGRQMIAWGTGYAFNPTDIWNAKSPIDPNAPKLGVNAIRVEIPFGSISGLTLVASPGADFKHSSAGFRLKGNLGGFDLSLCGMRVMTVDREFLGLPKKIMAGTDLAGQIGDVGVWAECAVINPVYDNMDYTDFDSLYVQVDAGLDYNFANGLYIMLEYYYNGLGKYKPEDYDYRDFMYLFGGDMSGFAQNYVLGGLRKDFLDHFVFAFFALGNLNDLSAMLLPELEYNVHDNISLKLSGQIGIGDEEKSEYGGIYSSIILKVTGFF